MPDWVIGPISVWLGVQSAENVEKFYNLVVRNPPVRLCCIITDCILMNIFNWHTFCLSYSECRGP